MQDRAINNEKIAFQWNSALEEVLGDDVVGVETRIIDHDAKRPEAEPGPTREWGEVLIGTCTGCHGKTLSGGKIPGGDPKWPPARNLTPDESGIKSWTFEDFQKAIKTGTRPDGTTLDPVMPYKAYAGMKPDDIKALWAYLQTVPAKPAGGR